MDACAGRCFLKVYRDGSDEPRLLQLEPTVKFHNVLKVFDSAGDLYWGGHHVDPQTTPAAIGMSYGVDKANTLLFIPAPPRTKLCGVSRVDSTAPLDSPMSADATVSSALCPGLATPLPAYFDDRAAPQQSSGHNADHPTLIEARMASVSAAPPPSWYPRPLLLSPVPPPLPLPAVTRFGSAAHAPPSHRPTLLRPPSVRAVRPLYPLLRTSARTAMDAVGASGSPADGLEVHGDEPIAASVPHVRWPPHAAVPARRNVPVYIDPHLLVDPASDVVESLQRELRLLSSEVRAMQLRDRLDSNPATPMRGVVEQPPGMNAPPSTQPSVEELAAELHDKQMHRLYEQRHLYLNHDHCV
ncbi:hypothetical protein GH5_03103 [Leishmania sp. Ghana 2012 LV757]|uniref:hypothetical protein n=1 Tax=Leishmania sp. Ghana 2012 LV757 TaxID=2803181 RepID=UPI001B616FDF|nr:hypothetical protein GH5_03103 [Leishmania sp. Ghana 2012 LV757]